MSIPTFTIQYLMESGQGLTSNAVIDKTLENMKHIWIISRICDKIEIENRQMGG